MSTIRCLYVEDKPAHQARYSRSIEIAWKGRGMRVPLEVIPVSSPEEALVRLNESEFQLMVVDILYRERKEELPLGLQLIAKVRQEEKWKHSLAILAISWENQWYTDAIKSGADEFLQKQILDRDAPGETLGKTLVEILRSKGHDPVASEAAEVTLDNSDLRLVLLVEWVGRRTLLGLATKIVNKDIKSMEAGFVRSGLSGAAVLRLDCDLEVEVGAAPDGRRMLLKLARDQHLLADELTKLGKAKARFPSSLFVPAISSQPVESNGWYGIGLEFVDRAHTFHSWVTNFPADEGGKIESALGGLFLEDGLLDVYQKFSRRESPSIAFRHILTPLRATAVLLSLEELLPLMGTHDKDGIFDEEMLREYLRNGGVASRRRHDAHLSCLFSLAHGDLHSRNILVDRNGVLRLVDGGSICELPWPADIARFVVDLIVYSLDAGADSHNWERLSFWISVIENLVEGRSLGVSASSGVISSLEWIRGNISRLHPEVFNLQSEYEFRLAVAIELLRSSYRSRDLSGPKRFLGLLGFCLALRSAKSYFEANLKRK